MMSAVRGDGSPSIVRFREDEIAEGLDLAVPLDLQPPDRAPGSSVLALACPITVLVIGLAFLIYRKRRRRLG